MTVRIHGKLICSSQESPSKKLGKGQSWRALLGRAGSAAAMYRGEPSLWHVFLPHSRRELPPLRRLLLMGGSSRGRRLHKSGPQNLHGRRALQTDEREAVNDRV